jgi:hypothetical protein
MVNDDESGHAVQSPSNADEMRKERLAIAAVTGLCSSSPNAKPDEIAERAIQIADAVLARLKSTHRAGGPK